MKSDIYGISGSISMRPDTLSNFSNILYHLLKVVCSISMSWDIYGSDLPISMSRNHNQTLARADARVFEDIVFGYHRHLSSFDTRLGGPGPISMSCMYR